MKKILLSSIALTLFSLSLILFDISCKKSSNAQTDTGTITKSVTQQGKIIYTVAGTTQFNSTIWTANYDGTNAQQINITMPTNYSIAGQSVSISPDAKTLFFTAYNLTGSGSTVIFACDINGTNPHQVVANTEDEDIKVAY